MLTLQKWFNSTKKKCLKYSSEGKKGMALLMKGLALLILIVASFVSLIPALFIYAPLSLFSKLDRKLDEDDVEEYAQHLVDKFAPMIKENLGVECTINIKSVAFDDLLKMNNSNYQLGRYGIRDNIINFGQTEPEITMFYRSIWYVSEKSKTRFTYKFISVLAHELRHAWQDSKGMIDDEYVQGKDDFALYKKQDIEKDANRFGLLFIIKNFRKIFSNKK